MRSLPLALTAEYDPPGEPGEYAHVVINLNGRVVMRIVADDPTAYTPYEQEREIRDTIARTLADVFRNDDTVTVEFL